MPRFWGRKRLRLFVRTHQARLWAPPGVEGSGHIRSSSCRTTVPSPSIRPWQVEPAQEATPRKRPPPSPCERAGEAPRSSASRSMTSTTAKAAGAAHDVSPRPCPACVPISAIPFARPAFWRLNHPEGKHRVGNLLESRDIGDLRSEEHTSELQSLMRISYAVFCLKKKNKTITQNT